MGGVLTINGRRVCPEREKNQARFTELVKQTYRVLLTRGMKGCYVYFEDKATREFFESRIDFNAVRRGVLADAATESQAIEVAEEVEV